MQVKDFDYNLPQKLIAQKPCRPRDYSRLMILNKKKKKIIQDRFYNIHKYLKSNDVLVANNSRVIPARLFGNKQTGGKKKSKRSKKSKKEDSEDDSSSDSSDYYGKVFKNHYNHLNQPIVYWWYAPYLYQSVLGSVFLPNKICIIL